MGFRNGAYAKVWAVNPVSDTQTKLRISISKKNKTTGEYDTDFSGFVTVYGPAAKLASNIHEGDRVKLGDVDVSNKYDKENNTSYTYYKVFSLDLADSSTVQQQPAQQKAVEMNFDNFSGSEEEFLPF